MQLDTLTREQLIALVAQMKTDGARKLTCKVSKAGAISIYGLGRWPVTLYLSQMETLIEFIKSGAIDRFIETNRALLSVKE